MSYKCDDVPNFLRIWAFLTRNVKLFADIYGNEEQKFEVDVDEIQQKHLVLFEQYKQRAIALIKNLVADTENYRVGDGNDPNNNDDDDDDNSDDEKY